MTPPKNGVMLKVDAFREKSRNWGWICLRKIQILTQQLTTKSLYLDPSQQYAAGNKWEVCSKGREWIIPLDELRKEKGRDPEENLRSMVTFLLAGLEVN